MAPRERNYSEETAREIDNAVRKIISDVFERAYRMLDENREVLESCAKSLLEKETLSEEDLKNLTQELRRTGERAKTASKPSNAVEA
jgi:cell division protease FtsH